MVDVEFPYRKPVFGNRFSETGYRKPVSENRVPETGFQNPHKTLSEQTFEKSTDLEFFQNRCENTMILIIFPESDFLKKVAHVHSASFAPIFNWG